MAPILVGLRDSQIGVHVTPPVVDEVGMRAGGPITFHAEARVADDNLVDGRADNLPMVGARFRFTRRPCSDYGETPDGSG
jgi:hypothetical protein